MTPVAESRSAGEAFASLVEAGADQLPLPGHGATLERFRALAAMAADDLCVARLFEGHTDARAILAELAGPAVPLASRWAVWAAEPPGVPPVAAERTDGGWVLTGRKPWCSGAPYCTHALVTASAGLFAVDLSHPGVRVDLTTGPRVGMSRSRTHDVELRTVPGQPVGGPEDYLKRPGFWHGGVGVAACWYGGAVAVAAVLGQAVRRRGEGDPHAAAHLGAVDCALAGARAQLREAAAAIDADPKADFYLDAARVRAGVEAAATLTLDRTGRALGAGPFGRDEVFAQRVADLTVYLRQSHAERDLAGLGLATDQDWSL